MGWLCATYQLAHLYFFSRFLCNGWGLIHFPFYFFFVYVCILCVSLCVILYIFLCLFNFLVCVPCVSDFLLSLWFYITELKEVNANREPNSYNHIEKNLSLIFCQNNFLSELTRRVDLQSKLEQ